MSNWQRLLALIAGGAAALAAALVLPAAGTHVWLIVFGIAGLLSLSRFVMPLHYWVDGALTVLGAVTLIAALHEVVPALWLALLATWLFAWLFVDRMANAMGRGEEKLPGAGEVLSPHQDVEVGRGTLEESSMDLVLLHRPLDDQKPESGILEPRHKGGKLLQQV